MNFRLNRGTENDTSHPRLARQSIRAPPQSSWTCQLPTETTITRGGRKNELFPSELGPSSFQNVVFQILSPEWQKVDVVDAARGQSFLACVPQGGCREELVCILLGCHGHVDDGMNSCKIEHFLLKKKIDRFAYKTNELVINHQFDLNNIRS